MRRPILLWLLIVAAATVHAQVAAFNGMCQSGGRSAVVQGLNSTNKLQGIIPSCRVEVFITGTTTHATIYADSVGTPLANPFTADALSAAAPGKWLFYAATGQAYDVTMSGGIPPNTYLLPVTLTGLQVSSGGGGGGGCSVGGTAGNFLVTNGSGGCTITNVEVNGAALTAPSPLNFVNSSTVTFSNPSLGDVTATASVPNPIALQHNDSAAGINQETLDFNDTNPSAPPGYSNVTFATDSTGRLAGYVQQLATPIQMQIQPPITGNYVILYPSLISQSGAGCVGGGGGVFVTLTGHPEGLWLGTDCVKTYGNYTLSGTGINPANVTAVYAFAITSFDPGSISPLGRGWGPDYAAGNVSCNGYDFHTLGRSLQQESVLTGFTGTTLSSATCSLAVQSNSSIGVSASAATLVGQVGLIVYATDAPPINPAQTLNIGPYLFYNRDANLLTTEPGFPNYMNPLSVTDLPNIPNPVNGMTATVIDALNTSTCDPTSGTGSTTLHCIYFGSTGWIPDTTNSIVYPGAGIPFSTGSAWGTSFGVQGTDTKLLTASTISGTGTTLCTDANGGATTAGCVSVPIGGSGAVGYLPLWTPNTTTLGNSHIDDGVTTTSIITAHEGLAVNDGSGNAGAVSLTQGTGVSNGTTAVTLTAPSSVTSYRVQLPGVQPSGSNTYLSCTAADPAVCSWVAPPTVNSATVGSAETVAFSATPTFSSSFTVSNIVLAGNITSFTMSGTPADGQLKTLCFKQGAGPYTVTPPAAVHGFAPVGTINNGWNCQSFHWNNTDSIWLSVNAINQ